MPRWPTAASTPNACATCWCAFCRTPTRWCSRSMSPPGRGATPSARPSAATTITPPATRPASRSSPAGPTSGSPRSASTATPGPPRSTPAGCTPWTTPTSKPLARSARCLSGCLPVDRCRGLCSTAATTPPSALCTSPTRPQRCWCGCAPTVASTTIRHHGPWQHGPPAPPRRQVQLRRPDHLARSDVAIWRSNLGGVLFQLGDLAGAQAQVEWALETSQVVLGPDHPTVATIRGNLNSVVQALQEASTEGPASAG